MHGHCFNLTLYFACFISFSACEGAEVVFHMAAPDSSINNYKLHHSVNVQGKKNDGDHSSLNI